MAFAQVLMATILMFGIYWTLSLQIKPLSEQKQGLNKEATIQCTEKAIDTRLVKTNCPSGFKEKFGRCYRFHATGQTWLKGNETCLKARSYLAFPRNEEERTFFMSELAEYPPLYIDRYSEGFAKENTYKPNYLAVGFYYSERETEWMTTRPTKLSFKSNNFPAPEEWEPMNSTILWFTAPPTHAYMHRDGIIYNYYWHYISPFICQQAMPTRRTTLEP